MYQIVNSKSSKITESKYLFLRDLHIFNPCDLIWTKDLKA